MAIGGGRDDEFEELLGIPTGFAEFNSEPVEEFGVAGGGAHDTEVFSGVDEALAEDFLPEAVDGDARGEGVGGVGDPLGESEAIAGGTFFEGMQSGRSGGGDLFADLVILAAHEDVGHGGSVGFFDLDVSDGAA